MATKLADAYVQIIPSAKGIEGNISSIMNSEASSAGTSAGSTFGSKFSSTVTSAISGISKVTATALTTAVTGVTALTTAAVSSYSEYEQLTGGIETLFGTAGKSIEEYARDAGTSISDIAEEYKALENAEETVMENASNAYKTAGLSANEYMETAVGMSASLISSLGGDTEAAADMVDMAITDMSDNVNKMGTSMESVQNAYSGFAKGNYTMLDNLSLGYGGTASEMERLIETAETLDDSFVAQRDETDKLTMSYDDIIEAIHIVQEDMGITGTTADEAANTISGSLSSMKSAWTNLVTGLADDNADLETLTQNLVETIVGITDEETGEKIQNGFIDNILPVIETSLTSIGTLIEDLVPTALDILVSLIDNALPSIVSAATSLLTGLVDALNDNMDTISSVIELIISEFVKLIPEMMTLGGSIISSLASAILNNLDEILDSAGEVLEMLLTGLTEHAGEMASGAVTIITKLVEFLSQNASLLINTAVVLIGEITTGLLENLDLLLEAGISLLEAVLNGLIEALPTLIDYLPTIIDSVVSVLTEATPTILDAATTMFLALVDCLPDILIALTDALPEIIDSVVEFLTGDAMGDILEAAIMLFMEIVLALPEIVGSLLGALVDVLDSVVEGINGFLDSMWEAAGNLWNAFIDVLADTDIVAAIGDWIIDCIDAVKEFWQDFYDAGKYIFEGLKSGMESMVSSILGLSSTTISQTLSTINTTAEVESPSKATMRTGKYLAEGLMVGWDNEIDTVKTDINKDLDFENNLTVPTVDYDSISTTSNNADEGTRIVINETIDLGDSYKQNIYEYVIKKIGTETVAVKVAQGAYA